MLLGYIIAIYDTYYWIIGNEYNSFVSAFSYQIVCIIWALNLCALIWMCVSGNGGIVNEILSWKLFIPLSRLTYSVYLTRLDFVGICGREEIFGWNESVRDHFDSAQQYICVLYYRNSIFASFWVSILWNSKICWVEH